MPPPLPRLPDPIPNPPGARRSERDIRALLAERILVIDGAMGTMIHRIDPGPEDFGGDPYEGCNEAITLAAPDIIRGIHEGYLAAGADIIETNTFGATPIVLAEYDLADRAYDINVAAARVARLAAHHASTPGRPRLVAGSIGPTTQTLSVPGGISVDALAATYREQVRGLVDGGGDLLLIGTCHETLNLKAAAVAARRYLAEAGLVMPIMISGTIETMGTMLGGQPVEALYASSEHFGPLSIGLNCSTGPEFMTQHIRALADLATCYVSCYPNAGLPDENGCFHETPELISMKLERFVTNGWLNFVGGCCGTTPQHIQLIAAMVQGKPPRRPRAERRLYLSGLDFLAVEEDNRPVLVGERTNELGSRKFKELIVAEQFEEASEVGRKQVRGGAQVLDVCLQNPDRDELRDTVAFMNFLVKKVKVPLMIDTTDAQVLEAALKLCQGKGIVNSINLEDGEERFQRVVPLLREYGAAVVVGCIDERGQAIPAEKKLEVARRSYDLLTGKYGIAGTDILFDPLVFPCASGDPNYVGSAAETIKGISLIKQALPDTRTVLGISNVSFGLPTAGREVMNAVFLYHATKAGLDFAIVNSQALERYASIPEEQRRAAEDLIYDRRPAQEAIAAYAAIFRGVSKKRAAGADDPPHLTVEERIARRVVEGTKEGLIENLNLALQKYDPLGVVNGPLMKGMDEVGRLFNDNQLIVAEVLQSAEVMKAAVGFLEAFMEKKTDAVKGKLVLATVRGDVHDIGKNLVEIILSNNGYRIVNLGIKVPSEALIAAWREHKPDAIGLSGLLVKSAQQMVATASDFKNAGIACPVLVGGAALTKKFTLTRIAPAYGGPTIYARDAMEGLDLMNQLMDPARRAALITRVAGERARLEQADVVAAAGAAAAAAALPAVAAVAVRSNVAREVPVPTPPDLKRHVLTDQRLEEVWEYVNPSMLYMKHLGLKANVTKLLEAKDEKALKLVDLVTTLQDTCLARGWMSARAVWKFFPAAGHGNHLVIYDADGTTEIERFGFPRQPGGERLCLADFAAERNGTGRARDYVAMFVTT
ncbi:MAG: methionine synthase, partial [Planctomycetes bacterium]|nr:methionine synthase [Planctomycetota bacterium]